MDECRYTCTMLKLAIQRKSCMFTQSAILNERDYVLETTVNSSGIKQTYSIKW